jgi:DNA-binding SARP family transcriptional activator
MSTDRLVSELWGDGGCEGAIRTVQTYVSQLRKLLRGEPASLDTRPGGYVLAVDPAVVDAYRFEQGVTAAVTEPDPARRLAILDGSLALWQGPPLGEFAGAGWADREATRLDALHLRALRRRYDTLLDLDRAAEAAAELEALVRAHRLDERLWAQFMLALYRSGRQADALGAYQQARRHLVDELGIDPGPELTELEYRILDHDPALATSAGSPTGVDSHGMSARGEVIEHSVSASGGELVKRVIPLLIRVGASEDAVVRYGAAESPRTGLPPFGADAATMREAAERLRGEFGREEFQRQVEAGRAMTEDDVIRLALDALTRAPATSRRSDASTQI